MFQAVPLKKDHVSSTAMTMMFQNQIPVTQYRALSTKTKINRNIAF